MNKLIDLNLPPPKPIFFSAPNLSEIFTEGVFDLIILSFFKSYPNSKGIRAHATKISYALLIMQTSR